MNCCLGTTRPLPQRDAERLQELFKATIATWSAAFGAHYTQLVVANAQAVEGSRPADAAEQRARAHLETRYVALLSELPGLFGNIRSKLAQVDATVALLCTRAGVAVTGDDDDDWEDVSPEAAPVPSASLCPPPAEARSDDRAAVRDALHDTIVQLKADTRELDAAISVLTRCPSGAQQRAEALRDAVVLKAAIDAAMKTTHTLLGTGGDGAEGMRHGVPPSGTAALQSNVPQRMPSVPARVRATGAGTSLETGLVQQRQPAGEQRQSTGKRPLTVRDRITKKLTR